MTGGHGAMLTVMSHDPWRTQLRIAAVDGDTAAIVRILRDELPGDGLQAAGDALLLAVSDGADGAVELADRCATALRARGWEGDELLAEELDHAGRPGDLKAIPVDVEALAMILEEAFGERGYLDLQSGEVWHPAAVDYELDQGDGEIDFEDSARWLYVESQGSDEGYRDMSAFIGTVGDVRLADALESAIRGKGAFRRFKNVLERSPADLTRWHRYSDDAQRGRTRAWLAGEGYRPGAGTDATAD